MTEKLLDVAEPFITLAEKGAGMNETNSRVFTTELMCPKCKIGKLQRGSTVTRGGIKAECDKCDYWFEIPFVLQPLEPTKESEQ